MRSFFVLTLLTGNAFALDQLSEAEDRRELTAALLSAAQAAKASTRERVAIALGRIQKPGGIDPLFELIDDSDLKVRVAAAFSLGQLGWDASFSGGRESEIATRLSERLKDANPVYREALVTALGKIALEETPLLVGDMLGDSSAHVRAAAVLALYRSRLVLRLRTGAEPALLDSTLVDRVIALGQDSDTRVREAVAYYFSRVLDARGHAICLELARDSEQWTRLYALNALAKQPSSEDAISAALSAISSPQIVMRVAGVQALAAWRAIDRLPPDLQYDTARAVRARFAEALSQSAVAGAADTLRALMRDPSSSVRATALRSLARLLEGDSTLNELLYDTMSERNWVMRQAAVEASANLPLADRIIFLNIAQSDKDSRVIATVVEQYATIEDTTAYSFIAESLKSSELVVRGTAIGVLSQRKESTALGHGWSAYQNSAGENWTEAREELARFISGVAGDESSAYLQQIANDPAPSVALIAIAELKRRGFTNLPLPSDSVKSFSPYRELKFKSNPKVMLETAHGVIALELFAAEAPIHTANMVGFAESGGYDGLPLHRVVPNFVVQGGDPDKTGWGSAGYSLRAEINSRPYERGTLGMPRSQGFDTGGVQFFINHIPTPHLDGQYTVFGRVSSGIEIVDEIEVGDIILKAWVKR